ncbi:efflux RND transporter periplasmic adaptor subunit [Candidatus Binatus soli]|jgi:RND family efflux transporter MFP subunit|uniref:efflux RND transporter periplasmic adaptor subunit n=1 Tax=Candidatus Binatus soli TaxID=1953413 RepID=UPI003D10997A
MNKFLGRTIAAVCILTAATGCSRAHNEAPNDSRRTVVVIRPQRGDMIRSITLPGDLVGLYQSTLYAKVTGYLKSISVDKGDWVKNGQVLAEIEVPELQQRLARARADLEVQHLTYQRLEQVWKSDPRLVARQDVDIAHGKYFEAKAQMDELEAMVSYTKIVAPFDGVITGRFVDPGALIKAGGEQTTSAPDQGSAHPNGGTSPVLSLALIDTMRTYVYVPEDGVGSIRRGTPAKLTLRDLPGRSFEGSVARYSNSLDLGTRTMLTEIDLKNPRHELYPGMYANVTLELERHRDALKLPEAAIGDSPGGKYVMIAQDGKLRRQDVTVGINTGNSVEIVHGLGGGETVVATLDPSIVPDEVVNIVEQKAQPDERSNMAAKTQ